MGCNAYEARKTVEFFALLNLLCGCHRFHILIKDIFEFIELGTLGYSSTLLCFTL